MRNQRNFLETPLHDDCIHEGEGLCHHATILPADAFEAPIRFVNYTILPKGASFGLHTHGDDNELYILLSAAGTTLQRRDRALQGGGYPRQPGLWHPRPLQRRRGRRGDARPGDRGLQRKMNRRMKRLRRRKAIATAVFSEGK